MDRTKRYELIDIITIAICGILSGADSWAEIELFGNTQKEWLETFLELPNGIPSHDTFGRVFGMIDHEEFEQSFVSWVATISELIPKDVVAIDGKTVRRSHNKKIGKEAIHVVSAFAVRTELVLGQRKIDAKSNELKAIPPLLELLHISGCIVTIDAAGCYTEIVDAIVQKDAEYVIAVKKNQPTLYEDIERLFETESTEPITTSTSGHGREETRKCWVLFGEKTIQHIQHHERWNRLNSIAKVENTRVVDGKTTTAIRYYISSLATDDPQQMLSAVRAHWAIENTLHWSLDVQMKEDDSRIRKNWAAENFALLRKIVLNLLKQEKTLKIGIKGKRLKAAMDRDYLLKVLGI